MPSAIIRPSTLEDPRETPLAELVHSIGAIVWEGDPETFRFTFVSKRAEQLLGYPVSRWLESGDFWLGIVHPEDKERVVAHCSVESALGRDHDMEYRLIAADGRIVWIYDSVRAVREPGRKPVNRGLMIDVTARKQLELDLRRNAEELEARIGERTEQLVASNAALKSKIIDHKRAEESARKEGEYVRLLQSLAIKANESTGVDGLFLAALDEICAFNGWPLGHVYRTAADIRDVLVPTELWAARKDGFDKFKTETMEAPIRKGEGLPGRVMESRKPLWVNDVSADPDFPRRDTAVACGLRSGFAFPVTVNGSVEAVLEFYIDRLIEPEPIALEVMSAIGTQIGRAIERETAAKSLRASERRYASLFQAAPDAIVTIAPTGTVTSVNPAAEKIVGYAAAELVGRHFLKAGVIAAGSIEKAAREFGAVMRDERREPFEIELKHKNGASVFIEVNSKLIQDQDVPPVIQVIGRDVTDRRRAQEQLRQSGLALSRAQRLAHIGSWTWDSASNAVEWSDELWNIYGLEPKSIDLTYETFLRYVHPDDRARTEQIVSDALNNKSAFEFEHRVVRKDGAVRVLYAMGEVLTGPDGRVTGFVGVSQDMTERKAADDALRSSQKLLAQAQALAHLGSWNWEVAQNRVTWSDEMYRIYGLTPQECAVSYEAFLSGLHPDDRARVQSELERAFESGDHFAFEYRIARADGTLRDVYTRGEIMRDAAGKAIRLYGTAQDVTPMKTAERQLIEKTEALERAQRASLNIMEDLHREMTERRRAEKEMLEIAGKEQMRIGQDLHDGLSQQLTGITFMVKALEQKLAKSLPEASADAAMIIDLVRKAIIETKSLSRSLYPIELENNGLIPALQELALASNQIFHIPVSADIDATIEIGDHAVATHLYRIAQEAIHNAAKHGKAKEVRLAFTRIGEDGVRLSIRDNGRGMPKELGAMQGMGLRNMQYRANMIGGALEIASGAEGTSVVCELQKISTAQTSEDETEGNS